MKPSLHELIRQNIYDFFNGYTSREQSDDLAEQIIKIVRDYHLVEDSNDNTL